MSNLSDVIIVGTNEVPGVDGGSYQDGEDVDTHNRKQDFDSNDEMKRELSEVIVQEFGRTIHALSSADRLGKSQIDADLFCTTFPCHLCTEQTTYSGIRTVRFIDSYPKILTKELLDDVIALEQSSGRMVLLKSFIGVAPHRYLPLLSSVDFTGKALLNKDPSDRVKENVLDLRLRMTEDDARRKE